MSGEWLLVLIILPMALGILGYLAPERRWAISGFVSVGVIIFCGLISGLGFITARDGEIIYQLSEKTGFGQWQREMILRGDGLGLGMGFICSLLGVLVLVWAIGYYWKNQTDEPKRFFENSLLILGGSYGVFLAEHILALCIFWGFLVIPFYLLLVLGRDEGNEPAKKALIILGGSDSLLLMGIALVWWLGGGLGISELKIFTDSFWAVIAYLLLLSAGLAKAGGMPFHTWIPEVSEKGSSPVIALVPAVLDKLAGIYLLVRVSRGIFVLDSGLKITLLIIGVLTVLLGVMSALVQTHFRRLLGFHSISQVGYMIIGIGSGSLLGVVGALFHMLNNCIYKSLLFLGAGEIEKRTGKQNLGELGGLSPFFPVSFFSFLVASLAISGIPPLNGFYSKWLIYQSIIGLRLEFPRLWVFILLGAMLGSALTLASFMKLLYSSYLGPKPEGLVVNGQVGGKGLMEGVMVVFAVFCLGLGIFGNQLGIGFLMNGLLGEEARIIGQWDSVSGFLFLLIGLGIGGLIYALFQGVHCRVSEGYALGERMSGISYSGLDFYSGLEKDFGFLSAFYRWIERGYLDLYELSKRLVFYFSGLLRYLHTGNLLTYVGWCLLGLVALLWAFFELG